MTVYVFSQQLALGGSIAGNPRELSSYFGCKLSSVRLSQQSDMQPVNRKDRQLHGAPGH